MNIITFVVPKLNLIQIVGKISYRTLALFTVVIAIVTFLGQYIYNRQTQSALLNNVLTEAGNNRAELEKVIHYFEKSNDPKKLDAALFLITNMDIQYHYSGEGVTRYRRSFDLIDSIFKSNHGMFNSTWDSIQTLAPPPSLNEVDLTRDINTIKGDLIIRHINAAFKAWNYPWARNLSFKDFCEYILPYKLVNEEPELWIEKIQKEYSWLPDSMGHSEDPKKACILINNCLRRKYNLNGKFVCEWDVNYSDLSKIRQGQCLHLVQLTAYVMRAMGLPVAIDFTPHWANKNGGHEWNELMYKGKPLLFMGCESDPGKTKLEFTRSEWLIRKIAKVYRKMYETQNKGFYENIKEPGETDPFFFSNPRIADVTNECFPVSDIHLSIENPKGFQLVYLCVFNDTKWQTIAVSKLGLFSRAVFKNVGKEIMYMPMFLDHGSLEPAGTPFVLTKEGELKPYSINKSRLISCKLDKKYPEDKTNLIEVGLTYELFYWDNQWISLGKKIATSPFVKFNNVPSNGLLLLRCLNKGKQERIFSYEQQKQVWW